MKNVYALLYLVCFLAYNGIAQTTLVLQPDSTTGNDASIYSIYPTLASPQGYELDALAWTISGNPYTMRGLMNFDLTSIPPGAVIKSASLTLYYDPSASNGNGQSTLSGSNAAWLQRITGSWNQSTVTWNNQPAVTTMDEAALPASVSMTENYTTDVTSLVQDMIDNPTTSFGFMISLQTEQYYRSLVFGSSNNPDSTLHPKLVVTYTSGCVNLTLQPNSETGNDASIYSIYPTLASPAGYELDALSWTISGNPYTMRGLMNFDLATIPAQSIIQSAVMTLYYDPSASNGNGQSTLSGSNAAWLQQITSTWNQNTVTWNNQPPTTTRDEAALLASTSATEDYTIDVTTLVQDMIDSPATSFGFMISLQTEQYYRSLVFGSSNNPDSTLHPKLDICYTNNAGIHELMNAANDVNIYPNPASSQLTIHSSSFNNETVTVFVMNMLGELMQKEKLRWNNEINLNTANLPAGVYVFQMQSEYGSAVKRFVKE